MIIRSESLRKKLEGWALRDVRSQLDLGLPLLRSVRSHTARKLASFIDGLPREEQIALLEFSVTRAFAGYPATDDELWNRAVKAILEPDTEDLEGQQSRLNKHVLREAVLSALSKGLGSEPLKVGPSEVVFATNLGKHKILTTVDFGGQSQLAYEHKVDLTGSHIAEFLDLQAWMGFGHTKWNEIEEGQQQQVADSITRLVRHFVAGVKGFL